MIEIEDIEAFLQAARDDQIREDRLAAIHTLTYLPLSPDAWCALAAIAVAFLRQLPASEPAFGHAVGICARIPVWSVREFLGSIARDPDHPSSFTCAVELARHGDAAGLQRLLDSLAKTDAEQAIERLACLPIEGLHVGRKPFSGALLSGNPMIRFWAALALARLGAVEPLEKVWDNLLSDNETPPIFHGDPWTPYHALTAARPLPERLHSFLTGLYEHELKRLVEPEYPQGKLPRNILILVGGLTGAVDIYGEPRTERVTAPQPSGGIFDPTLIDAAVRRILQEPFEPLGEEALRIMATLQPERAGRLMLDALDALEKESASQGEKYGMMREEIAVNAMLHMACALPGPLMLPLGEVVETGGQRWPHLPWSTLVWVMSRSGAEVLVKEFGLRIKAAKSKDRGNWLRRALEIASRLQSPAPFTGAGPGRERPVTAGAVIDDSRCGGETAKRVEAEPGTTRMAGPARRGIAAEPETPRMGGEEPETQAPRYIQSRVRRMDRIPSVEDPPVWVGGVEHLISVRIGSPEAGWPNPKNLVPFPYELLPPGRKHRLQVFLSEPDHLEKPLMDVISIRRSGPSTVAEFHITPRVQCRNFRARIVITHRNRIVQTAILTGRVVKEPAEAGPEDRIEHEIESVVRPALHDLRGRRHFDMAMAVNQTPEGEPGLLVLADRYAVIRGFTEIKERIDAISECLSVVALDAVTYEKGLHSKEGVELLRFLADNGRALYDFLIRDQMTGNLPKDGALLQIVNMTPDAYFPAEFIYDFATPAENATLCGAALDAFDRLDFSRICSHKDHETPDQPVVCPFGFWGLRYVIERHASLPLDREQILGDFVLQAEPSEKRRTLELAGNALLGVSAQVENEQEQPGATSALLSGIRRLCPIPIALIPNWQDWTRQVENLQPSLIITLPHAEEKTQFGVTDYFLEIGGELKKARVIGESAAHYVIARDGAPSPLVLLLGCNTTVPKTPIDSIAAHFRRGGAGIVVSTVGSVLGSHASKVARELLEALFKETAIKPRPLGELLRDVRRRCLGKKVIMALCIGAYGDADWQVHVAESAGKSDVSY